MPGEVLLAPDEVALYEPAGLDPHGWRLPGDEPAWQGRGNLQLGPGISDPRAGPGGGRGPFGPARDQAGTLYLPVMDGLEIEDGQVAVIRGRVYVLSQARLVVDPSGWLPISCWVATVTGTDRWPEPGEREPEEEDEWQT